MLWLLIPLAIGADVKTSNVNTSNLELIVVTNEETYLALEYTRERVKLAEYTRFYKPEHPRLKRQRRIVESLAKEMEDTNNVDDEIVAAALDRKIATARKEQTIWEGELNESHPKLWRLRERLKALQSLKQ